MLRAHRIRSISVLVLMLIVASACGLNTGGSGSGSEGGDFEPSNPEFLVHTGPGGGSDIFVRDVIEMMRKEGIIEGNWPVRNEEAGEGAGAMNYLMSKKGETDTISAMTTTWLTTPQTIEGATVTVDDLTPIAGLIIEPEVMAVTADSPYDSLTDFVEDAKQQPGKLVQTGGSTTEVGALNGESLQAEAGTDWKFLSFEEVGQRVAALLNDDADMMFGSAQDFASQVEAGKLKIIATISPEPSPIYPDAPTTEEEGFQSELVPQVRGIMGPPDMPQEAIEYYQGVFEETVQTAAWKDYAEKNGLVTELRLGEEWADFLTEQNNRVKEALKTADL
ncbi:MAG: tripartite tricarboxylate transporter substrate binding protein [Actinomycetota bacterium]|nr:tripartite tricarboxylate transporter substrate binding protein [Actinomycetota bacterium]